MVRAVYNGGKGQRHTRQEASMDIKLPEGFEVYVQGKSRYSKREPVVSIQKKGTINFNGPAKEHLGDFVLLAYNPKRRLLGLISVQPDTKGAYRVRQMKGSQTYTVSGAGLFASYGLDPDRIKGRYEVVEENGMYLVQLPMS
jgi:hypothetical protein